MATLWLVIIFTFMIKMVQADAGLVKSAFQCRKDDSCRTILASDESYSHSMVPLGTFVSTSGILAQFKGQRSSVFDEVPAAKIQEIRSTANSLGFTEEVTFDHAGHQITKFYKTKNFGQNTNTIDCEKYCLENNGILPMADMTGPGISKLRDTLVGPTYPYFMLGLKFDLVAESVYRLTWYNGQIFSQGTFEDLTLELAKIGLTFVGTLREAARYVVIQGRIWIIWTFSRII